MYWRRFYSVQAVPDLVIKVRNDRGKGAIGAGFDVHDDLQRAVSRCSLAAFVSEIAKSNSFVSST